MNDLCVCVGQSSIHIANEFGSLAKKCQVDSLFKPICVDSNPTTMAGNRDDNSIQTEVASTNEQIFEEIFDKIRSDVEKREMSHKMWLMADFTYHSTLLSPIIWGLRETFPGWSLHSINISAYDACGTNLLHAVINQQSAMDVSDAIQIREYAETLKYLETEGLSTTLKDINGAIAADLLTTMMANSSLSEPSWNDDWPMGGVCSSRIKLIDVRSSLWKSLKRDPKKSDYQPLRALSANLKALHSYSTSAFDRHAKSPSSKTKLWNVVEHAYFADFILDKQKRTFHHFPTTSSNVDVSVALNWACPTVSWPVCGVSVRRDERSGLRVKEGGIARRTTTLSTSSVFPNLDTSSPRWDDTTAGSPLPTSTRPSQRGQQVQQKLQPQSQSVSGGAGGGGLKVAAVSFTSPYASSAVLDMCDRAQALLHVGAFQHRMNLDPSSIQDAVQFLRETVEPD